LCVCVCPGFHYEHAIGLLICFQFISEIQFLVWLFFLLFEISLKYGLVFKVSDRFQLHPL
jgi:hypothetical protein